jgi:hypothetical protein
MQDWLESASKYGKSIDTLSPFVEIHKSRSKTLATRVKTMFDGITTLDPAKTNMNSIAVKGYLSMLLATLEEISVYFKILQKKDKGLGKRVKRFGADEETFCKWTETLQTCCLGVGLAFGNGLFDADQDSRDFNEDLEAIKQNLQEIWGLAGATELDAEAGKELLEKQQGDRTEYKTQQAVKAEKQFDAKLIRYEKIIGRGGSQVPND